MTKNIGLCGFDDGSVIVGGANPKADLTNKIKTEFVAYVAAPTEANNGVLYADLTTLNGLVAKSGPPACASPLAEVTAMINTYIVAALPPPTRTAMVQDITTRLDALATLFVSASGSGSAKKQSWWSRLFGSSKSTPKSTPKAKTAVGINWDWIFNPGQATYDAYEEYQKGQQRVAPTPGGNFAGTVAPAQDYTKSPAYRAAAARLAAAQAAGHRAPGAAIPVTVPSFNLPDDGGASGMDVLGLPPHPGPKTKKPTPNIKAGGGAGAKVVPTKARLTGKTSPHKRALVSAASVARAAASTAAKAATKATSYQPAQHKPVVLGAWGHHGQLLGATGHKGQILGAPGAVFAEILGATVKALTPKQKDAVAKHTAAMKKHQAAVTRTKTAAAKALIASKALATTVQKVTPTIGKLLKKTPAATRVQGDDLVGATGYGGQILGLGEFAEILGRDVEISDFPWLISGGFADILGAGPSSDFPWLISGGFADILGADPDPANPGFLTDGTPDPAYAANTTTDYGSADASLDNPPEPVPLPTRGKPLSADDARAVWQKVPDDGVIWQGDGKGPRDSIGSWSVFYGQDKNAQGQGYGWLYGNIGGGDQWVVRDPNYPIPMSTNEAKDNPDKYAAVAKATLSAFHYPPAEFNNLPMVYGNSVNRGWGPLIGNPAGDLRGLQYAMADNVWFWQSDNAPTWATAEQDAAIALLNKQTLAAWKAARDAHAAQMQQDADAAAEEQARQDAANALAESAAASQQAVSDAAVASQQAQLDIAAQKVALAQQMALAQQAQAQAQAYASQGEAQYGGPQGAFPADYNIPSEYSAAAQALEQSAEPFQAEDTTETTVDTFAAVAPDYANPENEEIPFVAE